ncbi:hypothetical protein LSTR_LSTR007661 [Laodelphax striatellus]|uniref:Uncharacterized protein n=1 Tax=Laodelphax striatellus TaxID=195883 RepID=A0A482WJA8_LAOST|nr:hypothetical protein LSTR_LSTR007661 [Laodelphax striatellus]
MPQQFYSHQIKRVHTKVASKYDVSSLRFYLESCRFTFKSVSTPIDRFQCIYHEGAQFHVEGRGCLAIVCVISKDSI